MYLQSLEGSLPAFPGAGPAGAEREVHPGVLTAREGGRRLGVRPSWATSAVELHTVLLYRLVTTGK